MRSSRKQRFTQDVNLGLYPLIELRLLQSLTGPCRHRPHGLATALTMAPLLGFCSPSTPGESAEPPIRSLPHSGRCTLRVSHPHSALLPAETFRPCFMPVTSMGFSLQSFLLSRSRTASRRPVPSWCFPCHPRYHTTRPCHVKRAEARCPHPDVRRLLCTGILTSSRLHSECLHRVPGGRPKPASAHRGLVTGGHPSSPGASDHRSDQVCLVGPVSVRLGISRVLPWDSRPRVARIPSRTPRAVGRASCLTTADAEAPSACKRSTPSVPAPRPTRCPDASRTEVRHASFTSWLEPLGDAPARSCRPPCRSTAAASLESSRRPSDPGARAFHHAPGRNPSRGFHRWQPVLSGDAPAFPCACTAPKRGLLTRSCRPVEAASLDLSAPGRLAGRSPSAFQVCRGRSRQRRALPSAGASPYRSRTLRRQRSVPAGLSTSPASPPRCPRAEARWRHRFLAAALPGDVPAPPPPAAAPKHDVGLRALPVRRSSLSAAARRQAPGPKSACPLVRCDHSVRQRAGSLPRPDRHRSARLVAASCPLASPATPSAPPARVTRAEAWVPRCRGSRYQERPERPRPACAHMPKHALAPGVRCPDQPHDLNRLPPPPFGTEVLPVGGFPRLLLLATNRLACRPSFAETTLRRPAGRIRRPRDRTILRLPCLAASFASSPSGSRAETRPPGGSSTNAPEVTQALRTGRSDAPKRFLGADLGCRVDRAGLGDLIAGPASRSSCAVASGTTALLGGSKDGGHVRPFPAAEAVGRATRASALPVGGDLGAPLVSRSRTEVRLRPAGSLTEVGVPAEGVRQSLRRRLEPMPSHPACRNTPSARTSALVPICRPRPPTDPPPSGPKPEAGARLSATASAGD
jgi:hypothetical protein